MPERKVLTVRLQLTEQTTLDPERPILRRVKILGPESANGRIYLAEAIVGARSLYENQRVNIDHPDRPNQPRSLASRFGKLEGIRYEGGDLYGDLPFNPRHPLAEMVTWFAEHDPHALGLSHNAVGTGKTRPDGIFEVDRIVEVRSVDLVADPATVKGLYEQREGHRMKIKFAAWLEQIQKKIAARLSPKKQARLKRLREYLEDDEAPGGEVGAQELEPPEDAGDAAGEADPHEQLFNGFLAAMTAIIKGDGDWKTKAKKIAKYLRAHEELTADDGEDTDLDTEEDDEEGGGREENDYEPDDEEGSMKKEGKKVRKPSAREKVLAERVDVLETREKIRDNTARAIRLCDEAKLPAVARTAHFMEHLAGLPSEKAMKEAIQDRKAVCGIQKPRSSGPVTGGPVPVPLGESQAGSAQRTQDFAGAVLSGTRHARRR